MSSDEHDINDFEKVIAAGDAWLRRYGVVSKFAHNNIVLAIRSRFDPVVKNLEYYIDEDNEKRKLDLTLYIDVSELLVRGEGLGYKITGSLFRKLRSSLPSINLALTKSNVKKLESFLDVLPNSDIPVFRQAKEDLIEDVRAMLLDYLSDYRINIRLKRYKEDK